MANWAQREHYPVDEALLRLRVPKVPEKQMEAYSPDELAARRSERTRSSLSTTWTAAC